ncbi:proline--tRNA ligase [Candidatus Woesearchaeota archaeon]|nr:proline--tRNA ligase [Candidatus Woesearchaeota archaeon]
MSEKKTDKTEAKKTTKGISVSKDADFSEWYSELVQKAELADLRYNIKGFVCYMPWAVITMKKMYEKYERILEKKGHLPLIMPSLIPESNFKLESDHVAGFAPEVFWVTEVGAGEKLQEPLALRPTSETALYRMYSYWIRSYTDLPFKRYQSCQVWRAEGTKATRPFLRAREFHWIETHNVFATEEESRQQIIEDMETTYEMIEEEFAIPIIFFQRPEWDKFPGAVHTFAADALMDSGKVIQLPSTHMLGTNFSKPFGVKFVDKDGSEKLGYINCYGPAISRIYGAMIAILGDSQGLILPFDLSPVQVVIVPIIFKDSGTPVKVKCAEIEKKLSKHYSVKFDDRDHVSAGEKFNEWELKGVPFRIELGPKDLEKSQAVVVNRSTGVKSPVKIDALEEFLAKESKEYTQKLKSRKLAGFKDYVIKCSTMDEIKAAVDDKKMACTGFCSIELEGAKCAEKIEKEAQAFVRGKRFGKDDAKFEKCAVCGKPAKETVYVAKSY